VAWRKIHFHDKDEWTGEVKETVWLWKRDKYSAYIKAPNGSVTAINRDEDNCDKPNEIKKHIEKLTGRGRKEPKPVYKHTDLDTVNFGVLMRDLHKKSPINWSGITEVFSSLKISPDLMISALGILGDLNALKYNRDEWTYSIKDPAILYEP
jgi:hypothetical protein